MRSVSVYVFICVFLAWLCTLTGAEEKILATIGNQKITTSEFKQKLKKTGKAGKYIPYSVLKNSLDELVIDTLLYQEALKKGLDKDQEFLTLLEEARKKILKQLLLKREVMKKVHYTEQDLVKYYQSHLDDFSTPGKALAEVLFVYKYNREGKPVTGEAKKIAYQIKEKLEKGESIAALHRFYTQTTNLILQTSRSFQEKRAGMIRRPPAISPLQIKVEAAIEKLKEGEVTVVECADRFVVIKVTDRKELQVKPFEQVKKQIETLVKNKKQEQAYKQYIESLKKAFKVKINYGILSDLEGKPPLPKRLGQ